MGAEFRVRNIVWQTVVPKNSKKQTRHHPKSVQNAVFRYRCVLFCPKLDTALTNSSCRNLPPSDNSPEKGLTVFLSGASE